MPSQASLRVAAITLLVAAAAAQLSGNFFDTPCAEGLRNITFSNNDLCDDVYDVYKEICHPIVATDDQHYAEMSQCCCMIKDAYKDRCDDEEESDLSDRMIMGTVVILVACFAARGAVRHLQLLWLPESAATIVVGMIAGLLIKASDTSRIHFSEDLFMRVFLPPILLEATLAIDKRSFRKLIGPILLFAIVGSIISTFGVGYLVHYGSKAMPGISLPAIESLLYGALISSVDPVAVLAVFNYFGIPQTNTLYVISFGESVLNDAAVVTLFTTIRSFRYGTDLSEDNINAAVGLFFEILAGSVAIGLAGGVLSVLFFKFLPKVNGARMEAILFFLFAFMPYYVADALGWSGIVAIVITGLIMDFRTKDLLCLGARKHIMFSVELLSMLFETAIFAYLGMFIVTEKYHWDASLIFLAIITAVGVRAFHVVLLSGLCNVLYRPPSLDDKPAINISDDAALDPAVRIHGSTSQRFSEQSTSRDAGNFMNIDNSPEAEEDSCNQHWCFGAPRGKGKPEKEVLLPWKYQFFLFYGGLRGALSFALAENVGKYDVIFDEGSHYHGEVLAMTAATILFHMLIMGGTVGFLLRWAGLGNSAKHRFKSAPQDMVKALNDGGDADMFESEPSSQISQYIPRYSVSS